MLLFVDSFLLFRFLLPVRMRFFSNSYLVNLRESTVVLLLSVLLPNFFCGIYLGFILQVLMFRYFLHMFFKSFGCDFVQTYRNLCVLTYLFLCMKLKCLLRNCQYCNLFLVKSFVYVFVLFFFIVVGFVFLRSVCVCCLLFELRIPPFCSCYKFFCRYLVIFLYCPVRPSVQFKSIEILYVLFLFLFILYSFYNFFLILVLILAMIPFSFLFFLCSLT